MKGKSTGNFLQVILCGLLAMSLAGCVKLKQMIPMFPHEADSGCGAFFTPYSGPKAKIQVADFAVEIGGINPGIITGLRTMLTATLINTNRFSLVEQDANLIITIAVKEFAPQVSGGRSGIGGGGSANSRLGGLLGNTLNKAYMAWDVRIADILTSKVLATKTVTGQATDTKGAIMGCSFKGWDLGIGLSSYRDTPMEKAIRTCLIEAARYISQSIPQEYYKY